MAFSLIVYVHLVCVLVSVYSECVPVSIKQLEGLLTAVVTPPLLPLCLSAAGAGQSCRTRARAEHVPYSTGGDPELPHLQGMATPHSTGTF